MDHSLPGSSVHEISLARILDWVAISFSEDIPDPGIEPMSPALEGGFFTTEPPGKALFPDTHIVNQVHEEKHVESQVLHY